MSGLASVHSWELFMRLLESRDPGRPKVTAEQIAEKADQAWPIVRVHPVTGARSLYINPKNTRKVVERGGGGNGGGAAELAAAGAEVAGGVALVQSLGAAVVGDDKVYAHAWKRGDFVIWDNRVLLHAATPFDADKYQRLLFRMEFKGEPVIGPEL